MIDHRGQEKKLSSIRCNETHKDCAIKENFTMSTSEKKNSRCAGYNTKYYIYVQILIYGAQ